MEVENQNPSEWALYCSNFSEFCSVGLSSLICEKGPEYLLAAEGRHQLGSPLQQSL